MSTALRPRSVTELFDAAFQILRSHVTTLSVLGAVAILPLFVARILLMAFLPDYADLLTGARPMRIPAITPLGWVGVLSGAAVAWLWFSMLSAALIIAGARAYIGDSVDPMACLQAARGRFLTVMRAAILRGLAVMGIVAGVTLLFALRMPALGGLSIFFAIPAIVYVVLRTYPLAAVATMEPIRARDAFTRTGLLTRGQKGRIFRLMFLNSVVQMGISFVFGVLAAAISFGSSAPSAFFNGLSLLVYAFFTIVQGVMYVDLRVRSEGYDIEVMAQQLAALDGDPQALPHGEPLGVPRSAPARDRTPV